MSGDSAKRPALPVLTSLRFFAAAEVVVYHEIDPEIHNTFLRNLGAGGYQAVTFFFVLSGFILVYVYSGRRESDGLNTSAPEFWRARAARILPAYLVGLAFALPHLLYATFATHISDVGVFIGAVLLVPLLLQAWWPPMAMAWNPPAWSLSVECFFYALFPALFRGVCAIPRSAFALLAVVLMVATTLLREELPTAAWALRTFFPPFHLPQFIFGMALGRLYLFGPSLPRPVHAAMLTAGAIAIIATLGARSILPGWTQTEVPLALAYSLVIFGGAKAETTFRILACTPLTLLGEASYALYIVHMPIGWMWSWITRSQLTPLVSFFWYFLFAVAISLAINRWIERPLRRLILGHREHQAA